MVLQRQTEGTLCLPPPQGGMAYVRTHTYTHILYILAWLQTHTNPHTPLSSTIVLTASQKVTHARAHQQLNTCACNCQFNTFLHVQSLHVYSMCIKVCVCPQTHLEAPPELVVVVMQLQLGLQICDT